eukprot:gene97-226_t
MPRHNGPGRQGAAGMLPFVVCLAGAIATGSASCGDGDAGNRANGHSDSRCGANAQMADGQLKGRYPGAPCADRRCSYTRYSDHRASTLGTVGGHVNTGSSVRGTASVTRNTAAEKSGSDNESSEKWPPIPMSAHDHRDAEDYADVLAAYNQFFQQCQLQNQMQPKVKPNLYSQEGSCGQISQPGNAPPNIVAPQDGICFRSLPHPYHQVQRDTCSSLQQPNKAWAQPQQVIEENQDGYMTDVKKSKFFAGNSSDSSSSDSDSGSSSSESEKAVKTKTAEHEQETVVDGGKTRNGHDNIDEAETELVRTRRWADAPTSSSDDGDAPKRVIRSGADKRFLQLSEMVKTLRNHMKISDFASLKTDYEDSVKLLEKLSKQANVIGASKVETPKFFVKAIYDLQEFLQNIKEAGTQKTYNQNKSKAFNTLRAKVTKQNADFQEQIDDLKANPEAYEADDAPEDDEDEDSSDSESEAGADSDAEDEKPSKKKAGSDSDSGSASGSGSDSDSDSDSSGSDMSSEYSSGSTESEESGLDAEEARQKRRMRWLMTAEDYEQERREREAQEKLKEREKERMLKKAEKSKLGGGQGSKKKEKEEEMDLIRKSEDPEGTLKNMSSSDLEKRLKEVVQMRGRKAMDQRTYQAKLHFYLEFARTNETVKHGPSIKLFLLAQLLTVELDSYSGAWFEYLKEAKWCNALRILKDMFSLLRKWVPTAEEQEIEKKYHNGEFDDAKEIPDETFFHSFQTRGFYMMLARLDDELYKALQFAEKDMQLFLIDSQKMLMFLKQVLEVAMKQRNLEFVQLLASRVQEHVYNKPDADNRHAMEFIRDTLHMDECGNLLKAGDNFTEADVTKPEDMVTPDELEVVGSWGFSEGTNESSVLLDDLTDVTRRYAMPDMRPELAIMRGQLCCAYHHAIHNRFREARDIMHFSSMYDKVLEVPISTQILYNRAFAQIGLCAFRRGLIPEAHHYLMEICTYNKSKELLAQGVSFQRFGERDVEREKAEKRRQLPHHMQIPLVKRDYFFWGIALR